MAIRGFANWSASRSGSGDTSRPSGSSSATGAGSWITADAPGPLRPDASRRATTCPAARLHQFVPDRRAAHPCAARSRVGPCVPKVLGSEETTSSTSSTGATSSSTIHTKASTQSVERFISDAADDPQTLSIKMTVYRVGDDTPFVRSLVRAAESGKQVACVIELKARFDEERNLHWATELERRARTSPSAMRGLKTHAKVALVVRRRTPGCGATCTSARATITSRRRDSTRTSVC